jgi:hypothetical protein
MKKIIGCFVLCLLVGNTWGMDAQQITGVIGEEVAVARERRKFLMMNSVLFYMIKRGCSTGFACALLNGADPNSYKECDDGSPRCFALHKALSCCNLAAVIALLQFGARLDVEGVDEYKKSPLDFALDLFNCFSNLLSFSEPSLHDQGKRAKAQYELLRAFSEHPFDLRQVYGVAEYKSMSISYESTELIQAATKEVNETVTQCVFDDFKYKYRGQSIEQFLRNKELGVVGMCRR